MENVYLSLILQFLRSSLRNSVYKSIISHSLPVSFWTAFYSLRKSPPCLLQLFRNILIKATRGIACTCDMNGVQMWIRLEKHLADSLGFLGPDLISGKSNGGTQKKYNLIQRGEQHLEPEMHLHTETAKVKLEAQPNTVLQSEVLNEMKSWI